MPAVMLQQRRGAAGGRLSRASRGDGRQEAVTWRVSVCVCAAGWGGGTGRSSNNCSPSRRVSVTSPNPRNPLKSEVNAERTQERRHSKVPKVEQRQQAAGQHMRNGTRAKQIQDTDREHEQIQNTDREHEQTVWREFGRWQAKLRWRVRWRCRSRAAPFFT